MSNALSAYLQRSDPQTSWKPGENGQLVDLDEYYEETGQDVSDRMIQGTESFGLGKVDRQLCAVLGVEGYQQMDPFPSQRNAVMGAEGFFSKVVEGFKEFIENIIKYIRMAFDWVANTVKGIFGFRKSERIEKAINNSLDSMKQEFTTALNGLGFPSAEYNLERFIGKLPNGVDRIGQLQLMKSKFETDREAIDGLTESLPLFQQCASKLTEASNKAVKASNDYRRIIGEEYNKTRARMHKQEFVEGTDSPEAIRLLKASQDVGLALNKEAILPSVVALLNALYKTKFSNQELEEGFSKVRKDLETSITLHAAKIPATDVSGIMDSIQMLNKHYVNISDNSIDMGDVNIRALGAIVDKTDADKMKAMSDHYKMPSLLTSYQEVAVAVRDYSNFCQLVTRQLSIVQRQIDNLTRWYVRGQLWYYHGILGDMEKLKELNREARAHDAIPIADKDGSPAFKFEFIEAADAQTFMENFGATSQEVLEKDIAGLRTIYNNFVKDAGIGKPI